MSKQANFSRKVTLESPDKKPSVFERLGTKSNVIPGKNVCRNWLQNGSCPLNKQCKLAHTHTLISPLKKSKSEIMKKTGVVHKKLKEDSKKSVKSLHSDLDWEGWELGDLEDADEKVLEKRKQELQRELQLQLKKEKKLTRKKERRDDKKRAVSSSSSSTTTTESTSSTSSSSTSSSEPKKRTSRKRKLSSSSSDSEKSSHRKKKSPKISKSKIVTSRKPLEKKDIQTMSETKSKSVIVSKKLSVQKKSYSPHWEKSSKKSLINKQTKKSSPHHSPECKNKSCSPKCDKSTIKNKSRGYSPTSKSKESSQKKPNKKLKDSSLHLKEKNKQSPTKPRSSPSKSHKVSSPKSRRNEERNEDKRRGFSHDRKHTPKRDRSKDRERKREVRRGRSNDNDSNGGLKKGGKILPLKPTAFNKDSGTKKEQGHGKVSEKNIESKSRDEEIEKDRTRQDREKEYGEKDKIRCEKDRIKHKKGSTEHDRKSLRERESERGSNKSKDERSREKESDRLKYAKDRESERQKERDEALERCRERQKERERIEKDRKEKEDKKHQRDISSNKTKNYERELPSLLDLKAEIPIRISTDSGTKCSDKHLLRENRRNLDKSHDKVLNLDREGRDRGTPDLDHDRRESRRSDENERRLGDKEFDNRKNREGDIRNSTDIRRTLGEGRRGTEEGGNSRRQWDDLRRGTDTLHERRSDRRQVGRRALDDPYKRTRGEEDHESRDFASDERLGRKVGHSCPDWDSKDQNVDFRNTEGKEEWNHKERHHDWNSRYDHKWLDREESRDSGWDPYSRRPPHENWNGEWIQDQTHQINSNEERFKKLNEEVNDKNGKRNIGNENNCSLEQNKKMETATKLQGGGDALSDISDDPDDILNQDDDHPEESAGNNKIQNSVHQIFIRSNEFLFEQRKPALDGLGERSLDFEEISDEELEEEARVTKGIVDVLGADWAGLVQETRPKPKRFETSGSAHRRWMMNRLLCRLGISTKYGGQSFIDKIIERHKNVKNEENEINNEKEFNENEIKNEKTQHNFFDKSQEVEGEDSSLSVSVDLEQKNENCTIDNKNLSIKIFHTNPALHTAYMKNNYLKTIIFSSHHRFKRALSARTDLSLRRRLSNFTSKEPLHFTPPMDNKLYEISMQQFQDIMTTAVV